MKQDENKFYAKFEIRIGEIVLNGVVSEDEIQTSYSEICDYITRAISYDLAALSKKCKQKDEILKVSDNLDSK